MTAVIAQLAVYRVSQTFYHAGVYLKINCYSDKNFSCYVFSGVGT